MDASLLLFWYNLCFKIIKIFQTVGGAVMSKEKTSSECSGMTLVEVVVTMMVVAMLAVGVYSGIVQGSRLNYAASQRIAAFGICRSVLEEMKSAGYNAVTATNFPAHSVTITHLGGSDRIPLSGMCSNQIATVSSPDRKNVTVWASWNYQGRPFWERVDGVVYYRDAEVASGLKGDITGGININPNNSPDNEFTLGFADGTTITRDDLTQDYGGYTGPAEMVHLKPKGNGNQNSLTLNGEPYTLYNANTYDITGPLSVDLYNDHINPSGKAVGKWWIEITAAGATIEQD